MQANGGYTAYQGTDQLLVTEGITGNIAHAPREAMIGNENTPGYFADRNKPIVNKQNAGQKAASIPDALRNFFDVPEKSLDIAAETDSAALSLIDASSAHIDACILPTTSHCRAVGVWSFRSTAS